MHRVRVMLALVCTLLGAAGACADANWGKLKEGLTAVETAKHLGEPLIRSVGRGFELWIYDGQGEVLFAGGPVRAWTVANPTAESRARPIARDVLIRPIRVTRLPRSESVPPAEYYREISSTRFRYQ